MTDLATGRRLHRWVPPCHHKSTDEGGIVMTRGQDDSGPESMRLQVWTYESDDREERRDLYCI